MSSVRFARHDPVRVEVYVASTPVDFRKGPVSLMALVRDGGVDPLLYVFRSKRADRVKIVWWDGGGICLFAKRSKRSRFAGPGSRRQLYG
jgi:transposase